MRDKNILICYYLFFFFRSVFFAVVLIMSETIFQVTPVMMYFYVPHSSSIISCYSATFQYKHVFSTRGENSADPDQMASSEAS